jgi:hypothetical protein
VPEGALSSGGAGSQLEAVGISTHTISIRTPFRQNSVLLIKGA